MGVDVILSSGIPRVPGVSVSGSVGLGGSGGVSVSSSVVVDDDDMGSVTDSAWQSLFKSSIHHGNLEIAEQVYALALEKQQLRKRRLKDSFPSPPTVETTTWLSQILRAYGKAEQWREAVRVADK